MFVKVIAQLNKKWGRNAALSLWYDTLYIISED